MKKIIITFLAGIIYLTNLGAQSYLYDKGSSGASLGVTRISGHYVLSLDMCYKGRFGVGASAYKISDYDHVVGINGTFNFVKENSGDNVFSLPITFGYFNNGYKALGASLYNKTKVSKNFALAIGLNYSRLFISKNSEFYSKNKNFPPISVNTLSLDIVFLYKVFKVGPSINWSKNTNLNFGISVGVALGHNAIFSEVEEENIEPDNEP